MKKQIFLATTFIILLTATPVFASKHSNNNENNSNGNSNKSEKSQNPHVLSVSETEEEESISPTPSENELEDTDDDSDEVSENPTPTITIAVDPETTPSTTPTIVCDPNQEWENHGKYVSCVALTHPRGKEVSEAARSDIGKKHLDEDEEISPTATPSPTISITPTETPPISSSILKADDGFAPFKNLGLMLRRFFDFLKHSI